MCNIRSYLLNINLHTPSFDFSQKSAFESGLLAIFKRYSPFSELVIFPCFRPSPYTRMCVSTIKSFQHVGNKLEILVKHKYNLGF